MKVLFILEYFPPYLGGVERLFDQLTRSLVASGVEVTVLTADYTGNLPTSEQRNGVEIQRLRIKNRFLFTVLCIPRALRLAKSADLIHTTSYNAGFPSFLAGLLRRKKVLITFHEYWGRSWFQLPFLKVHERVLFRLYEWLLTRLPFASVVAVSKFTETRLKESARMKRVARIYNGLDVQPKEAMGGSNKSAPPNFLFIGRLGVSKGIDLLTEAAKRFLEHDKAHFTFIVAKEPKFILDHIRSSFSSAGKENRLTILHEVSDTELYANMLEATAVVVPSYSEGFGFVAAEACAVGVPLIHSGRGSLNEVVWGNTIPMKSYTAEALEEAFKGAISRRYEVIPKKEFPTAATAEEYFQLYQQLSAG